MSLNSNNEIDSAVDKRLGRLESLIAAQVGSDEIDFAETAVFAWKKKWLIVAITVISGCLSVGWALWLPDQYRATVTLLPASSNSASSLSRMAGQFGGLAALAGVNLSGATEIDKSTTAIELIKSWSFQDEFIRKYNLQAPIYAASGWERAQNELLYDNKLFDSRAHKWISKSNPTIGQTLEPSSWELHEKLSKRITITQDKKTNIVKLSVEFYSPIMAKEWVDNIVIEVNHQLQERDRVEASKSIEYLEGKMSQTNLTEMKSVLSKLIEEQTKSLMLADVSDEYVFKTLSPTKVPEKKSGPARAVICILGTIIGFLLSVTGVLFWATLIRLRR